MNFLIKKNAGGAVKNKNRSNKELGEELRIPIIKKFGKRKHLFFIDDIWGTDPAARQLISKIIKLCICFGYSFERLKDIHNY